MRFLRHAIIILFIGLLTACHPNTPKTHTVRIGTITGPETDLMVTAKEEAKKTSGLDIEIVEFNDYTIPNTALNDGSIDANMFQHQPYLDATVKAKGYQLISIGKTFVYPMGIYSKKIKELSEVKDRAVIAIPNDPSNEARALLLLQKAGLITLKPNVSVTATTNDILSNPKDLHIQEIDAAQLPRTLDDVTLAVINSNYAIPSGLSPSKDALAKEDANSPYANIIVIRADEQNNPNFKELIAALQSDAVKQRAQQLFGDGAIPAW